MTILKFINSVIFFYITRGTVEERQKISSSYM